MKFFKTNQNDCPNFQKIIIINIIYFEIEPKRLVNPHMIIKRDAGKIQEGFKYGVIGCSECRNLVYIVKKIAKHEFIFTIHFFGCVVHKCDNWYIANIQRKHITNITYSNSSVIKPINYLKCSAKIDLKEKLSGY